MAEQAKTGAEVVAAALDRVIDSGQSSLYSGENTKLLARAARLLRSQSAALLTARDALREGVVAIHGERYTAEEASETIFGDALAEVEAMTGGRFLVRAFVTVNGMPAEKVGEAVKDTLEEAQSRATEMLREGYAVTIVEQGAEG